MSNLDPYKDIRREFFIKYFEKALPYEDYLKTGSPEHLSKWKNFEAKLQLTAEQKKIISAFKRKMPVLVLSGTWCGDCARQGPMLNLIAKTSNVIDLKFIDNKQNPELQNELRINGAEKVPVVVSFSEDFFEINRFGDKHLGYYRDKLATELGASCDAGVFAPTNELNAELNDWLSHFERIQAILRLSPLLKRRYGD